MGIEVEIVDRKANGKATLVKMPDKPENWPDNKDWPHLKRIWLPTSWLTVE
jgi:hypothetical protein